MSRPLRLDHPSDAENSKSHLQHGATEENRDVIVAASDRRVSVARRRVDAAPRRTRYPSLGLHHRGLRRISESTCFRPQTVQTSRNTPVGDAAAPGWTDPHCHQRRWRACVGWPHLCVRRGSNALPEDRQRSAVRPQWYPAEVYPVPRQQYRTARAPVPVRGREAVCPARWCHDQGRGHARVASADADPAQSRRPDTACPARAYRSAEKEDAPQERVAAQPAPCPMSKYMTAKADDRIRHSLRSLARRRDCAASAAIPRPRPPRQGRHRGSHLPPQPYRTCPTQSGQPSSAVDPQVWTGSSRMMRRYETTHHRSKKDQDLGAEAPRLPGCIAHRTDQEGALGHIENTTKPWIESAQELGRHAPATRDENLMLS